MTKRSEQSVGVVIPVFNGAAFLGEALASLAAQQRPPDQVVVVDDGSTDGSRDVAEAWRERLPLQVLSTVVNGGPGLARKVGIEALATDLIALLDADDVALPDHLRALTEAYAANGGGLITPNALRWLPGRALGRTGSAEANPVPPPAQQYIRLLYVDYVFVAALFDKSTYERVGGFRELRGPEDWDLWLRMVGSGVRVSGSESPTVLYRLHPASLSADHSIIPKAVEVLEHQLRSATDSSLKKEIARALHYQRSRLALAEAYALARTGNIAASRERARSALRGPPILRARAAAMVAAPSWAVHRRDRLAATPERQLRW